MFQRTHKSCSLLFPMFHKLNYALVNLFPTWTSCKALVKAPGCHTVSFKIPWSSIVLACQHDYRVARLGLSQRRETIHACSKSSSVQLSNRCIPFLQFFTLLSASISLELGTLAAMITMCPWLSPCTLCCFYCLPITTWSANQSSAQFLLSNATRE